MVMTTELERGIHTMCNLSEALCEEMYEEIAGENIEKGIEQGIQQERLNAIERMIHAGAPREQILSYGYTDEKYTSARGNV